MPRKRYKPDGLGAAPNVSEHDESAMRGQDCCHHGGTSEFRILSARRVQRRARAFEVRGEATVRSLPGEFLSQLKCGAKIKASWLRRTDHLPKQPELGLVLDVADGESTNTERAVRRQLDPIRHEI